MEELPQMGESYTKTDFESLLKKELNDRTTLQWNGLSNNTIHSLRVQWHCTKLLIYNI